MPQIFVNRTIDDQFGDSISGVRPTYSPASSWSPNSSCNGCLLHPDPALAFNHTWHDSSQFPGTSPVSLTLEFVGTAVYVYCIVPPITTNVVTSYNLNFTLDGESRGKLSHTPTSNTEFVYNYSVLSLESLPNQTHSLLISTDDSDNGSAFLFDYAVYTTVESKRGSVSVGTVAGCVVGGIILLILLVLALVAFKRKRQRQQQSPTLPVLEPFKASPQNFNPESRTRSESPAALVRQLQTALAIVVALRQAPAQAAPPTGNMLGTQTTLSESSYDTPPPVYRSHDRRSIRKSPAMI